MIRDHQREMDPSDCEQTRREEYQVVFDKRNVLDKGQESIPYGYRWSPSTTSTISRTVIPPVPDNLLYTLVRPSDAVGGKSTEMDLMEYDDTIDGNVEMMETDEESENDFETVRDSDFEFMNDDGSEEEELSFYRRFYNTF